MSTNCVDVRDMPVLMRIHAGMLITSGGPKNADASNHRQKVAAVPNSMRPRAKLPIVFQIINVHQSMSAFISMLPFKVSIKMVRTIVAFILLNAFLIGKGYGAEDAVRSFVKFLNGSEAGSKQFLGQIEVFKSSNATSLEFDMAAATNEKEMNARCRVDGDKVLLEVLGDPGMAIVGTGSKYNDILEVLAVSDSKYYKYVPVGSTVEPFANLNIFEEAKATALKSRIQSFVYGNVRAFHEVGGFPIQAALTSADAQVQVTSGQYKLVARHDAAGIRASLEADYLLSGKSVEARMTLITGQSSDSELKVEQVVKGEYQGEVLVPVTVFRKFSGKLYGDPRVEGVMLTRKSMELAKFPITKKHFTRYERNYTVAKNDSTSTSEMIAAAPAKYLDNPALRFVPGPSKSSYGYQKVLIGFIACVVLGVGLFVFKKLKRV